MKTKDELNNLKQKTLAELETDLKAKKSELLNLRFQLAINQLENPMRIRVVKKDIAKIKTVLRELELKNEQ